MSLTRKHLMILAALVGLLALTACTREITTYVQEDPQPSSCFECHSDDLLSEEYPGLLYAQTQWAESKHGEGETVYEGASSGCVRCHANEGFLQYAAGVTAYTAATTPTNIDCFTCHAPHTDGGFGLRVTTPPVLINGASEDLGMGNTCLVCHQARRDATVVITATTNTNNRFGPHHGPQGDVLLGTNGYEYEGFTYTETPYHRTLNEDGCVNCHMRTVAYLVGGHTFKMTAIDEEGEPVHNTAACTECHESIGEDFDFNGVQTEVDGLLAELEALLLDAGFIDAEGTPLAITGGRPADDAGAIWNWLLVGREDRSRGVHNPDYVRGLLQSSIEHMESIGTAN